MKIAERFTLPCGVEVKNRFFKSAMSEGLGTVDHQPTSTLIHLYEKWADGGTGILVTGNVMIDSGALGEPRNVVVEDERHLESLKRWAKAGTKNHTQLWMQLNHPGKQSPKFLSKEPVAPSAIPLGGSLAKGFALPRELTKEEIQEIVRRFATSAAVAKKVGFTGVQIHGAHGYLVSQFLSPHHNQRSDEYGGTLDNRMRFVIEIYHAIRQEVGESFPISIKLNSADFQKGGFTEEDSLVVVNTLANLGMDLIEISGGTYERPAMTGVMTKESTKKREAYFLAFAEEVKQRIACPVVVTGGFRTVEGMEQALQSGATDFIGIARPLALMPDLPNQILSGTYQGYNPPQIKTGIKAIDKNVGMTEIIWFEQQLKKIGQGKIPDGKDVGLYAMLKILLTSGWHIFQKRRAT